MLNFAISFVFRPKRIYCVPTHDVDDVQLPCSVFTTQKHHCNQYTVNDDDNEDGAYTMIILLRIRFGKTDNSTVLADKAVIS